MVIALGTIGGDEAIARMEAMLKSERYPPSLRPTLQMALRAAKEARQQERDAAGG